MWLDDVTFTVDLLKSSSLCAKELNLWYLPNRISLSLKGSVCAFFIYLGLSVVILRYESFYFFLKLVKFILLNVQLFFFFDTHDHRLQIVITWNKKYPFLFDLMDVFASFSLQESMRWRKLFQSTKDTTNRIHLIPLLPWPSKSARTRGSYALMNFRFVWMDFIH